MGEDSVPGNDPRLRTSLGGYNRGQVDELIAELGDRVEALQRERSALAGRLGEQGEQPDLDGEIDAVTSEVGGVLHAANQAADSMRAQASEDAARWRAEADAEARTRRREAQESADNARGDAWTTGTDILEQARSHAAHITRSAENEALTIRAEAEREASRYVNAARKDIEEEARQARLEAERNLEHARLESDRLINQANLEAEAAQSRAQALEERRAELMAELESAQEAISQLEAELEARKESLRSAGRADTGSVRVLPTEPAEEWFDDDETVLVVRGNALAAPEPIDADEFVDEVRQLREGHPSQPADGAEDEEPISFEPGEVAAPTVAGEAWDDQDGPPGGDEDEPSVIEEPAESSTAAPLPGPDDIDSLFDRLRGSSGTATKSPNGEGARPATASTTSPSATTAATATSTAVAARPAPDPFDVRDRLLLPVTNRALRELKRALVDLQNLTLEELRTTGEGWRPDEAAFRDAFDLDLEFLAQESLVAGYAAAADLAGKSTTPHPDVEPVNPSGQVAGALWTEVDGVAEKAAAAGLGPRQAAAEVSRVFRTWRTDGAERWLRMAAFGAYHEGVVWGLAELGTQEVVGIADGRTCSECPASSGATWKPGDITPAGTRMPPAGVDCGCTIGLP